MLGRPPAAAVMSTSLSHHQHTTLQQQEDLAASAADLDSYEVPCLYQSGDWCLQTALEILEEFH